MTFVQWMGIGVGAFLLFGFIIFAFRQGLKVKPNTNARDNWRSFGGPPPHGDNPSD
jgi:hypothetical protein